MSDYRQDAPKRLNGFREGREPEDAGSTRRRGPERTERPLQKVQNPIRVALIEDNRLVREALTTFLDRSPDIRVIGGDPDGLEPLLRESDPDVVLVGLGLAGGDSVRFATEVLNGFPDARVIGMDLHPDSEDFSAFMTAGVSGFIMKDATMDDVLGTIRAVAAGLTVLPDRMTGPLFSEIAREPAWNGGMRFQGSVHMTPREREVLELIAEGLRNKAIAKELKISIHTVKSHLRNIMDKLSVNSRLQVAKYVHQHAALEPSP